MSDLDRYSDVLSADVRAVWPKLAAAVADIDGALFGGTALAVHLRHRQSFDLDYMTYTYFAGEQVAARLAATAQVDVQVAAASQLRAVVAGVVVEVFSAPHPSDDPHRVQQVAAPAVIEGLAVASMGDLLAAKLDVLLWRAKLRDFIDIAAIDQSERLRIEDGLRLHIHRYGTAAHSGVLDEIVDLLEDPGVLASDPVFAEQAAATLSYLAGRAPELRDYLAAARAASGGTPALRQHHTATAATVDAAAGDTAEPAEDTTPPAGTARGGRQLGAGLPAAGQTGAAGPRPALRGQIIEALQARPRASYPEIARLVGASPGYVGQVARGTGLRRSP